MDVLTYAVRALCSTLTDNLPGKLAALDAERDAGLLRLSDPAVQVFARPLLGIDRDVLGRVVALDRESGRVSTPYTTGEWLATVRLDCYLAGPAGSIEETLEATHAFAAAIHDVVRTGDGRGAYMVGGSILGARLGACRPVGLSVEPGVRAFGTDRHTAVPVGRAFPEFTISVWQD